MNNQENMQMQGQQQEPTLQDIAFNDLCMKVAHLEGRLSILYAENEILKKELEKLRKEKEDRESDSK